MLHLWLGLWLDKRDTTLQQSGWGFFFHLCNIYSRLVDVQWQEVGRRQLSGKKMAGKVRFQFEGVCVQSNVNQNQQMRDKRPYLGGKMLFVNVYSCQSVGSCSVKRLQQICGADFGKAGESRPPCVSKARLNTFSAFKDKWGQLNVMLTVSCWLSVFLHLINLFDFALQLTLHGS